MSLSCVRRLVVASVGVVSVPVLLALPAAAQIPDEFTNLQLLDKEISKPQLIGIMRDWAGGLGVRCNHCHVGPENLVGMDFATDDKPTKRTARRMLELARKLNGELLADLPTVADGAGHQVVSCYTCHRGQSRPPRNLRVELATVDQADGLDAAIARFRELRKEQYGAGRYDFSARSVLGMAQALAEQGRFDDAARILALGLEYEPDSADLHAGLGMTLAQSGKLDEGKEHLEKALELDPENRMATFGLRRLEAASKNG